MRAFLSVALITCCTASGAADLKAGWLAQFQQDTFSGESFPGGYVSEITKDFQKAGLSYVCSGTGPTFAFYPRGFGFEREVDVDFRGELGVQTFHFGVVDLPRLGASRVLSAEDAVALKAIFADTGGDVPYRQGETSGVFPSVGADQIFQFIDAACDQAG